MYFPFNKEEKRSFFIKNIIKLIRGIILAAVIGFAVIGCDNSTTGGGGNNNNNGSVVGDTIVSGATVIYEDFTSQTDFSYCPDIHFKSDGSYSYKSSDPFVHINTYINGASVKINNGKLTINLGTPKLTYNIWGDIPDGITISDKTAKYFEWDWLYTQDKKYYLYCMKSANEGLSEAMYVDKDVTVTGSYTYTVPESTDEIQYEDSGTVYTYIYKNFYLKKGWNYILRSYNDTTKTYTISASTTLPSDYNWIVAYDEYWDY